MSGLESQEWREFVAFIKDVTEMRIEHNRSILEAYVSKLNPMFDLMGQYRQNPIVAKLLADNQAAFKLIAELRGDFDNESADERTDIEAYEEDFLEAQDLAIIEQEVIKLFVAFDADKSDTNPELADFMVRADESTVYNTFKRMLALDESVLPQKDQMLDAYILSCTLFRSPLNDDKERLTAMFETLRGDDDTSVVSIDLGDAIRAGAGAGRSVGGDDVSIASTDSSLRTAYSSMTFNPAHVGNSGSFVTPLKERLSAKVPEPTEAACNQTV